MGAHLAPSLLWCCLTPALLVQANNGELLPFQWVEFCSSPPLLLSKILWVAQGFWIPCQWFCSLCQAGWEEKIPAVGCWSTPCSMCLVTKTWSFVLCMVYRDAFVLSTLLLTWSLATQFTPVVRQDQKGAFLYISASFSEVSNGLTDCWHLPANVHPPGEMAGLMGLSRCPSPEGLHLGSIPSSSVFLGMEHIKQWQRFYISGFFSFSIFNAFCVLFSRDLKNQHFSL